MKFRSSLLSFSLVLALFSTAPILRADDGDTPLEKQMQTLARGTKQLAMQVGDPAQQQGTVTLIESLKTAITTSKGLEPRKTSTIPAADKEQFLTAYRAQLDKLTETYNQIETAVKAGQYDQAKSLLAGIGPIKKEGHMKFKQD